MRRLVSLPLVLILAAGVHLDWHLARPPIRPLSLGWRYHWISCLALFALAAWYVARRWPRERWRAGAWNVALALFAAQVLEPLLEGAYLGRWFGYSLPAVRWIAFAECVAVGVLAFVVVLAALRVRSSGAGAPEQASADQ
jgi:hypothetical protein